MLGYCTYLGLRKVEKWSRVIMAKDWREYIVAGFTESQEPSGEFQIYFSEQRSVLKVFE